MSPVTRTLSCLLAGWLLLTTVGCATLNLANIDLRSRKATRNNPVVKVVCIWEAADGKDPKGVPCQGFAGQILFLNSSSLPVSVDGEVKIYEFDDKGSAESQVKPLHVFTFDGPSWTQHYSYGTLGPAYSVFVPYMRRDVREATCALRVRLTPKYGPQEPVFSDMASIQLVGIQTGKPKSKTPNSDSRVEEVTPEDLTTTNKLRRTTTIVLNAQKGMASDSADPASGSSSQVQQAGYHPEDEVKPLTRDDARAAQLEQMVQELRALQGTRGSATKESSAKAPSPPPRRLDDEADEDQSRIRLRGSAKAADPSKVDLQMDAGRSPGHPLDDTSPSRVISNWTETHPLEESGPALSAGNPTAGGNRPAKHRHPLDDDQPVEEAGPRKSSRTNRGSSQIESDRSLFDPFDPIDTEAIKSRQ